MQFYFIRHGQSVNNLLWDRTGASIGRSHDPELTDVGRRQAEALAQFLLGPDSNALPQEHDAQNISGFGITHLYSSLMVRAVETGTIIAERLGLPLVGWECIHEGGGIYLDDEETGEPVGQPGNTRAFFEAHYPGLVLPNSVGEAGWWNRPFEPPEERPLRAQQFLRELLERHGGTDHRVAVVSHGGFYNRFMTVLLGVPNSDSVWFVINNVAMTRIDFGEDGVVVVYTNRADFLPRDLIT